MESPVPALLFLVPFVGGLLCAITAWWSLRAARGLTVAVLVGTSALSLYATWRAATDVTLESRLGGWVPAIGIEMAVDHLSGLLAVVVAVVALITIAGSLPTIRVDLEGRDRFLYPVLLILVSGLMGMIVTRDLFNAFVHLEVVSLSAYSLVATGGRGAASAAMKYLIVGSLGASTYLLGVGFLYTATGALNMGDAASRLANADPRLLLFASGLMVGGLAVKMGLFPFHGWMPAAYARSPGVVASVMAPLVTKVAAFTLLRILYEVFGWRYFADERVILEFLCWTGAIAVVYGGLSAMLQSDLRRLLTYSSISQMGLIAVGFGLANETALTGSVLHIVNDAVMKALLFLAAAMALLRFRIRDVDDLTRLRGRAPWTSAAIAVCGFSLIGLPPFCGFFGKWYILEGAIESERWGLVAAIVVGSLATAGYVFRLLERLYLGKSSTAETRSEGPAALIVALAVLTVAVIAIGLGSLEIVTSLIRPGLPAEVSP